MSTTVIGQEEAKKECIEGDLNKNLDCDSSFTIKGNIPDGLKVVCRGTLTVGGTVGSSEIICHGDLIVDKGFFAAGKSNVIVKGNLKTESISGAQIEVEKNITVKGNIINSIVKCRNNVSVGGAIEGGELASASAVITRRIGKDGQTPDFTKVEAGTNFRLKVMYDEMDQEISEISGKADKIRTAVQTL
ncbi:MAG: DUF342 domain-containing protein, partial [Fibrobacteres bacterium]|nr:DUF342 domain-containing protein [Fibrobacterota bacterium]